MDHNYTLSIFQLFLIELPAVASKLLRILNSCNRSAANRPFAGDHLFGNHVTYMPSLDFKTIVGEAQVQQAKSGSLLPAGVMTTGSKPRIEGRGYLAAVRRFPNSEFVIRRLASHSETFRDICEELAEAETVLSKFPEVTTSELHEVRKQEWQALVDRLVAEVAASVRRAKHE